MKIFKQGSMMEEHRQQQARAKAEDSWDECQRISARRKSVLEMF
jgi:hypothetical protein